jgi:hypothetical protein
MRAVGVVLAIAAATDAVVHRRLHGKTLGFVPYDFRLPTMARVRERVWAPEAGSILSPTVVGVGWTVNLGRVARLVGIV